jgi:CubicO group peptidase (beta-lactamase class C family)
MPNTDIHGTCDPHFAAVRDAFAGNFAQGLEAGASFCATLNGEPVIDIWAGVKDEAGSPWERDTIVNVYSTTKTMTALTALLLADRGQLDVTAPVARYWPEFAAAGKEKITVAHLLSHSAGLSGWDADLAPEDAYDWTKMTSLLAGQAPWWEPGTASGYHALSQGYLVGEVVRRIAGKSLGTVFREEIAGPLGADFWIGLPASEDARVADLIPPEAGLGAADDPNSMSARTFRTPKLTGHEPKTRAWRAAEIPAAGGIGNARSIAEIQTVLANGGVSKGKRIMSEAGARRALEMQIEGTDLVFNGPMKFGLGYGLPGAAFPVPHPDATCFWGGWGGSLVLIDMEARLCLAYAMNKMANTTTGDMRAFRMILPMFQALQAKAA